MKITEIHISEINIPLTTPFKTSRRTVNSINDLIIQINTNTGLLGFGEAAPTAVITGDTKGSIICAIRDYIGPAIVGMEVENIDGIMKKLHSCIYRNTSAKAAVDMAVYDLYAKSLNRPLYKILGGAKSSLETDLTISVNSVEEMVRDCLKAVESGYRILKVKAGKDGKRDIDRIKEIRSAVGPDIQIRVDANQGWTVKEAVAIITAMEELDLNIELVEQPVKAHDIEGMKYITAHSFTPIAADESVCSPEDALRIIQMRGADLINIKLMKSGGIYQALKICHIAETYGMECMIGCMLESKLSVSAAAHLAAGKGVIMKTDLDGPGLCSIDPINGGPHFDKSNILMTEEPGIGFQGIPPYFMGRI